MGKSLGTLPKGFSRRDWVDTIWRAERQLSAEQPRKTLSQILEDGSLYNAAHAAAREALRIRKLPVCTKKPEQQRHDIEEDEEGKERHEALENLERIVREALARQQSECAGGHTANE
jgi:hypothetical protein